MMTELERCRHLLREADALRFEDPRAAVRVAEWARDRAAAIDREKVGIQPWLVLQADAWSILGSALRSASELQEAEGSLNVALAFLDELEAHVQPLAHARLAQRAAHLRCDQGRFEEALALIDEAIAVFRELRAGQTVAGAVADRGMILGRAGRKEEGVDHLLEALGELDPHRSQHYFLATVHNMALYLHEMATTQETNLLALRWLRLACRCHVAVPESISLLKLRTLRGLTMIRLGQIEEGIHELWQTQEGFQRLGAAYERSLTLLHLAAAYLAQGRPKEVKRVAAQLFPLLCSLRIDREASAALILFYNTAQSETVTLELVDRISATLREAQARSRMLREES